jgi:hypothetical protein
MSHPSPLPHPAHLLTIWTPSSRPVPRFARLLHPTPLLLQVLRSLTSRHTQLQHPSSRNASRHPSLCHARPWCPHPRHQWHRRLRFCHARPSTPARATHGLDAPTRTTRSPGFTLHRAPPAMTSGPTPEPYRAGSSVYHPADVARDPHNTHPMVTRRAAGVTKLVDSI